MWVFQERRTGSAPYMNPKWPSAQLSNRLHEVKVLVVQLYLTLFNLLECSLPDSSVHGILQARTRVVSYSLPQQIFLTQGLVGLKKSYYRPWIRYKDKSRNGHNSNLSIFTVEESLITTLHYLYIYILQVTAFNGNT